MSRLAGLPEEEHQRVRCLRLVQKVLGKTGFVRPWRGGSRVLWTAGAGSTVVVSSLGLDTLEGSLRDWLGKVAKSREAPG